MSSPLAVVAPRAGAPSGAGLRRLLRLVDGPYAGAIAMLCFVGATNRWVSWADAVGRYHDGDPISYRSIAAAAPGLLHARIAEWHAERFIPNYLIGCLAKLFGTGLTPTYRVACVLLAVVICLALAELLVRIRVSRRAALVCLAAFILNPYGLRYFFFGVGRVADLMFILGAVVAVRGLAIRSPPSLLAGLLIATSARQTALPAALVAGIAVACDPGWGVRLGARRRPFAVAVVVLPILCYTAIRIIAAPFSGPAPDLRAMTLLGAHGLGSFLDHLARSAVSLLPITALLAAAAWMLLHGRVASKPRAPVDPDRAAAFSCLSFGAAIAVQPFLLNPVWVQDSEPRLAVLALGPLVVALALLLRELAQTRRITLTAGAAAALIGLFGLGSFHHIFTVTGAANKGQTVALESMVAIAAAAVLLRLGRRRARARVLGAMASMVLGMLLLLGLAGSASGFSKAIWGQVYRNGINQFPTYKRLGVSIYEAGLDWSRIAPRRPLKPTDPNDPSYHWPDDIRQALGQADRFRIRVLLQVIRTPSWANGRRPPPWAPTRAADYADFVTAAARHYRGVHLWMIWGEPTRRGNFMPLTPAPPRGRLDAAQLRAPHTYARMLDAAYAALKRVSRRNLVIGGCTYTTGAISTAQWIQNLRLPSGRMPRMDIYAHNPFSWQSPSFSKPPSPDGAVQFSDLPRLARWIDRGLGRRLPIFLSEWTIPTQFDEQFNFWVDPPVAARWISDALALSRRWSRIYGLGWINVYDTPPLSYGGLLSSAGVPKPSFYAFAG